MTEIQYLAQALETGIARQERYDRNRKIRRRILYGAALLGLAWLVV